MESVTQNNNKVIKRERTTSGMTSEIIRDRKKRMCGIMTLQSMKMERRLKEMTMNFTNLRWDLRSLTNTIR